MTYVPSSTAPAGADTQVQFNNAGVFDGDANLNWQTTGVTLNVNQDTQDGEGFVSVNGSLLGGLLFSADTETIAAGVITVEGGVSAVIVDTESAAASDDLDTISFAFSTDNFFNKILVVRAANDARTVVLKDETGNLHLAGDMSLTHTDDTITLMNGGFNVGWLEISRSSNTA